MAKLDSGPQFPGADKEQSVSHPRLEESAGKNILDALKRFDGKLLNLQELAALRDSLNDSSSNDRNVGPYSPLAWSLKTRKDLRGIKQQPGHVLFGESDGRGAAFCLLWKDGSFVVNSRSGSEPWKDHYLAALRS